MNQKLSIIIGVMLLSLNIWAQQPPMFNFTPTNSSGTFYGQAEVDGFPATANDWIAAFDTSGNCAGATALTVNSGVAYINLVIYGDDGTTPAIDEGMSGNEEFTLKLYQASSGLYLDYPSSSNIIYFSDWANTNGAPIPDYSNVTDLYDFINLSLVSFSLNISLCENENPILLSGGQPSGGIYSGVGVVNGYFDPSVAGSGIQTISYTYNGSSATAMIEVIALADASLITSGPFCANDAAVSLNSVTDGGIYSGSGVIANSFNPSVVGAGSYWITYTLTDTNNCVQDEETLLSVNASPNVPTISQSGNTLNCNATGMTYQWFDAGMNAISGATSQSYLPTSSGNYYIEVSNGFCSEISNEFSFILNSINQKENSFNLIVQNEKIIVKTDKVINKIKLLNIKGQQLIRVFNTNEISVKNLTEGLYLLIIENNRQTICRKIIL